MQTQITARHFDASPELRQHAQDQLSKLEQYYDRITDARIILSENGASSGAKEAEVMLNVYSQQLHASDNARTHEEALDGCVRRLQRQIKKYKSRLRSKDKDYHR